jgi:cephalosporin-C deacetylase-like acetyl esterase
MNTKRTELKNGCLKVFFKCLRCLPITTISLLPAVIISMICITTVLAQQTEQSEKAAFSFEIKIDNDNAIYKCGTTAKFRINLRDSMGKTFSGAKFTCKITGDWSFSKEVSLVSSADSPCIVEATLSKPGFILCKVKYKPDGDTKTYEGRAGAAFDPLLIKSDCHNPDDLDAFWAKTMEELAAIPMKATMMPVEVPGGKIECFEIKVDCAGGAPVSGYFAKPIGAKPGSLPAHIRYPGFGVRSAEKPIDLASQGFLAMDVNAHGLDNGKPAAFYKELEPGILEKYRCFNSNDPEKIYFRGIFMRVIRALEFLKTQPEWDGRNLIVSGGSQGGGQALVAAALDPKVSFCVAYVSSLRFTIFDVQNNGWPKLKNGQPVSQSIVDLAPYYDIANLSKLIKCPCILSTGFIDTVCSPTTAYIAFNNIPSKDKRIINEISGGHGVSNETSTECSKVYKKYLMKVGNK